ncbi:hypothetical protein Salat_2801200 [Sesamum alatum]|uniref:Zinc knuckle CX2CX4HX4C domain-containing protein n=1 Tax=Sesamum alatum TaxID=300844 RepID=A0AAE2C9B6_9LAMI|nr:hypothetical protein Salat_2801200 [Sesamum alatum]
MTNEVASWIRNRLGTLREVDMDSNGPIWGSSIRIRVAIDVTFPLKRAMKIRTMLGDEQFVTFTYERLPATYVDALVISHGPVNFNFRRVLLIWVRILCLVRGCRLTLRWSHRVAQ